MSASTLYSRGRQQSGGRLLDCSRSGCGRVQCVVTAGVLQKVEQIITGALVWKAAITISQEQSSWKEAVRSQYFRIVKSRDERMGTIHFTPDPRIYTLTCTRVHTLNM